MCVCVCVCVCVCLQAKELHTRLQAVLDQATRDVLQGTRDMALLCEDWDTQSTQSDTLTHTLHHTRPATAAATGQRPHTAHLPTHHHHAGTAHADSLLRGSGLGLHHTANRAGPRRNVPGVVTGSKSYFSDLLHGEGTAGLWDREAARAGVSSRVGEGYMGGVGGVCDGGGVDESAVRELIQAKRGGGPSWLVRDMPEVRPDTHTHTLPHASVMARERYARGAS